ncbi:sel1 repeat family protein [Streptomyces gardneri]|uniref:Tetratricopeptide repeat protein n=1 Tax=Streptomyces gardneri TaxID=66892 RepID=A0A4Y3RWC4_9ACTN|nr:sel1 repeat family protein [Streptomyces gardneri]GEB61842.1 hypothetical protein SGA01_74470 [Streptomyces gardneri]GHH07021.1 hypothetical protein GCM10017674_48060 [Streptomyces gardneri]
MRSQESRELYERLRALERRAEEVLCLAGDRYSRRKVSQALGKPPYSRRIESQRISAWVPLRGEGDPQVPSDRSSDDVLALVRLWSAWAGEKADERDWRNLLERAQPIRVPRAPTAAPGRPVREFGDPFALEVHEAIDGGCADSELPLLPPYVEREHDRQLAGVVESIARPGAEGLTSALAVLVGNSSTGKTRACWEALRLLPPDWRLAHPLAPNPAEALIAVLDDAAPRTVLWLDEIHRFLSDDRGEQAAARLHEVLNDPRRRPLLVLGTTWPEQWSDLVRPRRQGDRRDLHARARALLTGKHLRVPDSFEGPDMLELRRLAATDPRLQEALERGEEGQVTQYLAGGRALVDRYETATALERALVESAMDARRLGHGVALPRLLLEASIPFYLTAHQYEAVEDGDIEHALAELRIPLRGARGPLTPVTIREPAAPLVVTGKVRLADYLDQHGREKRHGKVPPARLWDTLDDYAARESLIALAGSARERGHLRIAVRLLRAAAGAGVPGAVAAASQTLEEEGRYDEALLWCLPLAERGDPAAMNQVAGIMEMTHQPVMAVAWHKRAAEAGRFSNWLYAGMLLRQAGDHPEAEACLRRAADAGVYGAFGTLADLLESTARTEEALACYRQEAEGHGGHAVVQTVFRMRERGDSGATVLSWLLPRVWEEASRNREGGVRIPWASDALFEHLAQDAALRSSLRSLFDPGGEDDEAQRWLAAVLDWSEKIASGGHLRKSTSAPEALRKEGRLEEALALYEQEAAGGRRGAVANVAAVHEQLGRATEAVIWYQRAAEEGDLGALGHAARLMTGLMGPDEPFAWLRSCADRHAEDGYPDQRSVVAELLQDAGRTDEALDWLRHASRTGDPYAWSQYAKVLESAGRTAEAQQMRRYGWEPDGEISTPWSAAP